MKCLSDHLTSCEPTDALWIESSIGRVDVTALTSALASVDPSLWQGRRVGIGSLPVLEFVTSLVFLDGLVQAIVFLPLEDDPHTREARIAETGVDFVVEGEGFCFTRFLTQIQQTTAHENTQTITSVRPAPIQTTWLLPTSGTTGTPKLIAHTFSSLTRSMATRRIGTDYIWGSLYSLRRFAGLQVFLQSWMSCTPLILNEEDTGLHDLLIQFHEQRCNALSATPSMWRKLAMHPLFEKLLLQQITLGGEIVDQATLDFLAKKFPRARITHIYASTEAGVGFSVRDGLSGFPATYLSQSPAGVAIRIDENNHLCFGSRPLDSAAADSEEVWIDTGDVVEIKADRILFLGRANGSINVGGNKVMPEEIESVIKEIPNVAFVQVRARKSAMLGNLVEAAITPTYGTILDSNFKKEITAHCRSRLDSYKVPAFIVAADDIHLNASGKISRTN